MTEPSDAEIKQAAEIISRLPKGFLPFPLFAAITSKIVTPTLELVIVREQEGTKQVLLTKRPEDDAYWPGQWHVPGTVIRSTDEEGTFATCFARILGTELHGLVDVTEPTFVTNKFWDIARGREVDHLFYARAERVGSLPSDIQFFPVEALPDLLMERHQTIIAEVTGQSNGK